MKAIQPIWHEFTAEFNFAEGLEPHFAAYSLTSETGSKRAEFTASGEQWVAKLYSQDSNIVHPGETTHTGTPWKFETMREFRIHIARHPDEDEVGKQKLNAHMRPRWQGMVVESSDGSRSTLSIPDDIEEGVSLRASGANIDAHRYQGLIRAAASALDMNPGYFRDPHGSSTVQDGERYVRIYEEAAGPIHARDGPIANLGHLLENDRSGYRKVVQNDEDVHGRQLPGYYHTVTLGPRRVREAFPTHSAPVEIKHYYAREAHSLPDDHPLSHPKLGVSYQVSRWDGKIGVTVDDLHDLERQLDRTLHATLEDAGVTTTLGTCGGPFCPDAYFDAETGEAEDVPELNLTRIRNEQESIVIRELTANGGLSPVEEEALETLVTDGGQVSPADIAEQHGRHVASVRRALSRIEGLVEHKYGSVSLRSTHIAEMVYDSVQQMREASRNLTEAAGQALLSAERGLDDATSALMTWCAKHGVDVDTRGEAIEAIRLGEVERRGPPGSAKLRGVKMRLLNGLKAWTDAGRDAEKFKSASVRWREEGRGRRTLPASHPALLGT